MRTPLLLLASLVLGLPLGCNRGAPAAAEKAPPATVKWNVASSISLTEQTELVGTTMPLPDHAARVSAAIEGRVLWVFGDPENKAGKAVAEGQRVEQRTPLVQLDTTLAQASLAKADATQEVLVQDQQQAQIVVEVASHELDRLRKLKEVQDSRPPGSTQLVSPVDLMKADYALKDAQSKLKGAAARLAAGSRDQDFLRAQLKLYTLTAPITGHLGRVLVVPGQTLTVGTPVADIVDLDEQIDVLCFVPPSLARRLQVGQSAISGPIEKDPASDETEAAGQVQYIAEQAEPETGNFAVKIRFDNKDAHFRSNRILRLHVETQPPKECLALPQSAVSEDEPTPTVVIVEPKVEKDPATGKEETFTAARRLQAVLGLRDREKHFVEILSLSDPDKESKTKWQGEVKDQQFIVEGGQGLQTGDKVKMEAEGD